MATKAELEAELAELRAQLAQRDTGSASADADAAPPPDKDDTGTEQATEQARDGSILPGFDDREIADLLEQLTTELEEFPTKNPLLSTITAFALGFALGRLSKPK